MAYPLFQVDDFGGRRPPPTYCLVILECVVEFMIPIAFFAAVAYNFKVVVESRTLGKIMAANVPEDLIRSMLQLEETQKRHSALRWGVVMVCMAIGFAFIDRMDWHDAGPGAIA